MERKNAIGKRTRRSTKEKGILRQIVWEINFIAAAMSAVATTIGALGNKNESKQSLTRSAVGNNIHFTAESQDEKTQQNLTALSRDTENANQKVQAYDLAEIRENKEIFYSNFIYKFGL